MKRILVTGGSGFVGSYVSSRLKEAPDLVVDVLGEGCLAGIRLGQPDTLMQRLSDSTPYDVVVNLAAHIWNDPEKLIASNFHGIHDVLDFCNNMGVGRLIHLSRSFVVRRESFPVLTTRLGRLYEYSKKYAELLIEQYSRVPASIFRITAPIWPTMPKERYLSQMLLSIASHQPIKIFGQGRRIQNYIRLDDISDAISADVRGATKNSVEYFMVCGPENLSDFQLAETVCSRLNVPFNYELVTPPAGISIDESNYGIEEADLADCPLRIITRPIDSWLLREHLQVLAGNLRED